jgi:amino acid adenylation domain-containing protein/thioester reductase-like protein
MMLSDDQSVSIQQLVERQVSQTPDTIAITFKERSLTYRELNQKANQLAHHLKSLGVKPESLVGVCLDRSPEMLIALLAILKAGGAYVPLDPSYPLDRLAFVMEDTQLPILLTQQDSLDRVPQPAQTQLICLDQSWQIISRHSSENLSCDVTAENLAYTIYTSGSTGNPKGVQITHHAAVNFLNSMRAEPGLSPEDVILAITTISFDIAVLELFLPLIVGAQIILVSRETATHGAQLANVLSDSNVTVMQATPSTWRMLISAGWQGNGTLKMLCGGEALTRSLADQLLTRGGVLWQMYGPTETTVWSMVHKMELDANPVSLGHAIANTQIYLIAEPARRKGDSLKQVEPGTLGEVYIGGDGVARGYFNRPDLTREKFIPDPFSDRPGARLYKTGDLARYLPDGSIQFIGRVDHQVKIRGHRIELGDIETALSQHPQIKETAVIAYGETEEKRLVAYVAPRSQDSEQRQNQIEVAAQMTSQWKQIWNTAYNDSSYSVDYTFNTAGWNSSYTGNMTSAHELQEWVHHTIDRILALKPQSILEIGCGTGLLLFRLAPHCDRYVGTDITPEAIDYVKQQLQQRHQDWSHVTLHQKAANALADLEPQSFDTIVLNSVVQYFPSVTYLVEVLETAIKAVKPGGRIFVGDVRNLALLEAFHTSVQLYQSLASFSTDQLRQRIRDRVAQDKELVIDPAFFTALQHRLPQISQVQIHLKRGAHHNELTCFRYDVVLHVGADNHFSVEPTWLDWQQQDLTLAKVRQVLLKQTPELMGITGIPNARILSEIATLQLLKSNITHTVEDLRQSLHNQLHNAESETAVDPEDVWQISADLDYHVSINWSAAKGMGCYDAIFCRRSSHATSNSWSVPNLAQSVEIHPLSAYANDPLSVANTKELVPQLRAFLREKLPAFMVPSSFVILETLPLTPNGKIDRRALPAPSYDRPDLAEPYVAPRTLLEHQLAQLWKQVLGIEQVGVCDSFFDLGGHSLLVTQLVAQVQAAFHVELSLMALFQSPTIAGLAQVIELLKSGETAIVTQITEADLQADTRLDPSIYPDVPFSVSDLAPQHIFLTGATGFLGAFLLQELLAHTQATIHCLVRAESDREGQQKLRQNLERYTSLKSGIQSGDEARILPVLGDLSQPLLGISAQHFQQLADKIDVIYHNGAFVNLIYPYTALRAANVLGTQEILRLASQVKTKPVHFISTLDVFQSSAYAGADKWLEQDNLTHCHGLYNGYAQSKWVAEKLVMAAHDRGIPTCIYRPGMIVGHRQTGVSKTDDLMSRIIKGFIQLGSAPDLDLKMNLTPVDYVSRAIVQLSGQPHRLGQAFHLVNPYALSLRELVNYIQAIGYPVQRVPYAQWQSTLSTLTSENALSPLRALFAEDNLSSLETLSLEKVDRRNVIAGLADTGIDCCAIVASLNTYFSYFAETGFLEVPKALEPSLIRA